jgi:hypothetical protein
LMFCECFCLKHTTDSPFIFLYFPIYALLHFAVMLSALIKISDFFTMIEFSVECSVLSPFAVATWCELGFKSTLWMKSSLFFIDSTLLLISIFLSLMQFYCT